MSDCVATVYQSRAAIRVRFSVRVSVCVMDGGGEGEAEGLALLANSCSHHT